MSCARGWWLLLLALAATVATARPLGDGDGEVTSGTRKPFAVVSPVEGHTKLRLEQAGLDVLRQLRGPVAPVVVIGPYRSGKSFLLNQLLGVGCDEGFGVGHTRRTQTKGVWMWGEPLAVPRGPGQPPLNLLLFDTEGFEATGKANAYDDRIFALSTVLSSVLIYNLPETVRESDVQALSFAVQLAKTFYDSAQAGRASPMEAANMLWLIQRDFLEGQSVQQMVDAALRPVANPGRDADIEQVNRIRLSLRAIAGNSTAFGLRQPHLERTRLCELSEDQLEPAYLTQRSELQQLIRRLAKPKLVSGAEVSGPELAGLIERMVAALNSRDIPTAGSILEHFNRELIQKLAEQYAAALEAQQLPVELPALEEAHAAALAAALARFEAEKFGSDAAEEGGGSLRAGLEAKVAAALEARRSRNALVSQAQCTELGAGCEDEMETQQHASLPSLGRFETKYKRCRELFDRGCAGPGRQRAEERLEKAFRREMGRFRHDYNDKLFNGLELLMLVDILVFRFFLKSSALETLGWLGFFFLQIYPKLFLSGGSMYDSDWWQVLVRCWEVLIYNPLMDLQQTWQLLLLFLAAAMAAWRGSRACACACPRLRLGWHRRKDKRQVLPGTASERDLGV